MTIFESKVTIGKPIEGIYCFLADMNNHQRLMPESIQNWSSSQDEAHFDIQNMASLALKIESRIENDQIKIIAFDKPPFDLDINWTLKPVADATEVTLTITADLNMMMKMLASGPLQKLANSETQALADEFA